MDPRSLIDHARDARQLGGITISTTAHGMGTALAAHYHEREYFCFVTDGRSSRRWMAASPVARSSSAVRRTGSSSTSR
jgi:hypothetical protein